MPYIPRDKFISQDPEKRMAQLQNLVQNRMKRSKRPNVIPLRIDDPEYKTDIIKFAGQQFYIPETKSPIILEEWQKEEILKPLFYGDREFTMALIGQTKKSGKSTLAALIAEWFLFCGEDYSEIYLAARDKDQASWIVFSKLVKAIEMNKYALIRCKITKDAIEVPSKGSVLRCLPTDVSCAGLNPNLVVFDELWSYEYESMKNFFEEMTTVPTRKNPLALIVTYAGYDDESLLYQLYKKGMKLEKNPDPTFFFYWEGENKIPINRMPWQSEKYLLQQEGRLRKNTFLRLHENKWVEDITQFIDMDKFDLCVSEKLTPILPDKNIKIWVGVDASISGDSTAVVAVTRKKDKIILANYKKWQPTKENPIDLEETVEKYLIDLSRGYDLKLAFYDPYQLHRSAVTLKKKGLFMRELPQTVGNTIDFSQTLYDLIQFGNIEFYPSPEVRRHIKSCKAKEMDRGYRIIKEKHSEKIDIAVALAMASLGAVKSFNQEQEEPSQIIHYDGPGAIWVENPNEVEKPFNFPHLIKPGDPDY
jgi:phage terminase large subunit-like protein